MSQADMAAKFWRLISPCPVTGCWWWTGREGRGGYGSVWWGGRKSSAHRVAHELEHGPIPNDLLVLHSCDQPACCNPSHLRVGTQAENVHDRVSRGRSATGARNAWGRDRAKMLASRSRGDDHYSRRHPERLARGNRNGSRSRPEALVRGETHHAAKLTEADVRAIRAAHAAGMTGRELARRHGVSTVTVSMIILRKTWAHVP